MDREIRLLVAEEDLGFLKMIEDSLKESGGGALSVKVLKTYNLKSTFRPTSAGRRTAGVRITSNDPDTPILDIVLTGTGQ